MITDSLNPVTFLAFLGLLLGVGAAVVLGGFALVLGRDDVAKLIGAIALGGVDLCLVLLLSVALTSPEQVLGRRQEKPPSTPRPHSA